MPRALEDHRRAFASTGRTNGTTWKAKPKPTAEYRCRDCGCVQERFVGAERCLNVVETTSGRVVCGGDLKGGE